jgi:hypothetical protein
MVYIAVVEAKVVLNSFEINIIFVQIYEVYIEWL